ncbi:MAG: sialidase family protein [Eubacteriales bacterium]|nr:sialidase family protein [Eubacteriales bacterium]
MSDNKHEAQSISTALAADTSLFSVWDPSVPFPSSHTMQDVDIITNVTVERTKAEGCRFLHEVAIAWHKDRCYICWANHSELEPSSNRDNLFIRGCCSDDGIHWSNPEKWVEPPALGAESYNHPVLFSCNDKLYGFFVGWREGNETNYSNKFNEYPITEIFVLEEDTGKWQSSKACIPDFVPLGNPILMPDGNWIISGEHYFYDAAVAISKGNDFTEWELIDIPKSNEFELLFPETAVVVQKDRLIAVCRPQSSYHGSYKTAPVSQSNNWGRSWMPISLSNFPLDTSKPFSGWLSTGQNYLITNDLEDGRTLLSIAVTERDGGLFKRIFKIRHQSWPARRLFGGFGDHSYVGYPTEWSYPSAVEHNGNLYVVYSQGKEDCVLSIIPLEALLL